jgi:hypothetical protein
MSESRPTPGIELDGLSPDEAFSVLGNEIRLDIVRVLWQPTPPASTRTPPTTR